MFALDHILLLIISWLGIGAPVVNHACRLDKYFFKINTRIFSHTDTLRTLYNSVVIAWNDYIFSDICGVYFLQLGVQ